VVEAGDEVEFDANLADHMDEGELQKAAAQAASLAAHDAAADGRAEALEGRLSTVEGGYVTEDRLKALAARVEAAEQMAGKVGAIEMRTEQAESMRQNDLKRLADAEERVKALDKRVAGLQGKGGLTDEELAKMGPVAKLAGDVARVEALLGPLEERAAAEAKRVEARVDAVDAAKASKADLEFQFNKTTAQVGGPARAIADIRAIADTESLAIATAGTAVRAAEPSLSRSLGRSEPSLGRSEPSLSRSGPSLSRSGPSLSRSGSSLRRRAVSDGAPSPITRHRRSASLQLADNVRIGPAPPHR
jgi:hypothetical protein